MAHNGMTRLAEGQWLPWCSCPCSLQQLATAGRSSHPAPAAASVAFQFPSKYVSLPPPKGPQGLRGDYLPRLRALGYGLWPPAPSRVPSATGRGRPTPFKPVVTTCGAPVPRPDLQDVLQLHAAKGASAADQCLQHAVHRRQGLQGVKGLEDSPGRLWGSAVAPCCPERGLGAEEVPMFPPMAHLGVEESRRAPAVLWRQAEDALEAGLQDAVLVLLKQPGSTAGTQRCSSDSARRGQTLGVKPRGAVRATWNWGEARLGPVARTSWWRWPAWLAATPRCPGSQWAPPAAATRKHSKMRQGGAGQVLSSQQALAGLTEATLPPPSTQGCQAPWQEG